MTESLDLEAIRQKWLRVCGACDAGVGECSHPAEDYRPVMLALVAELDEERGAHAKTCSNFEESAESWSERRQELEAERRTWEYFAGLAFAYFDAGEPTVEQLWTDLAVAIKHYRRAGGAEPRDPETMAPARNAAMVEMRGGGDLL